MKHFKRALASLALLAMLFSMLVLPAYADGAAATGQTTLPKPIWQISTDEEWSVYKSGTTMTTGVDGASKTAAAFDGTVGATNTILCNTYSSLSALSFSVWINPSEMSSTTDVAKRVELFHSSDWGKSGCMQAYFANGKLCVNVKGNNVQNKEFVGFGLSLANEWTLMTVVYDSAAKKMTVYADGVVAGETDYTTALAVAVDDKVCLGRAADGTRYFKGAMEDFRLYNTALTAEQVGVLYAENKVAVKTVNQIFSQADLTEDALGGGTYQTASGINGGTALRFDGSTYYTSDKLNGKKYTDVTVSAWVRTDKLFLGGQTGRGVLFNSNGDWSSNLGDMQIYFQSVESTVDSFFGGVAHNGNNSNHTTFGRANCWTHVTMTYCAKRGYTCLYYNGALVHAYNVYNSVYGSYAASFATLSVGGTKKGTDLFSGLIQDFAIYDGVLSANEIKKLAAVSETTAFQSVSMTLTDDFALNFFSANVYDAAPTVTFEQNGKTLATVTGVLEDGAYKFTCGKILPQSFGEEVTATLTGTVAGKTVTATKSYSVKDYCMAVLGDATVTDATLKTLVVDILNYGAAAQTYVGETAGLVNADLNDAQKQLASSATPTGTAATASGAFTGYSLLLESPIQMRVYLTATDVTEMSITLTVGSRTVTVTGTDFVKVEGKANTYYVTLDELLPTDYNETITVTLGTDTLICSVNGYLAALNASAANANAKALGNAVYAYGVGASAYVQAHH